jgi:hypothetical protein
MLRRLTGFCGLAGKREKPHKRARAKKKAEAAAVGAVPANTAVSTPGSAGMEESTATEDATLFDRAASRVQTQASLDGLAINADVGPPSPGTEAGHIGHKGKARPGESPPGVQPGRSVQPAHIPQQGDAAGRRRSGAAPGPTPQKGVQEAEIAGAVTERKAAGPEAQQVEGALAMGRPPGALPARYAARAMPPEGPTAAPALRGAQSAGEVLDVPPAQQEGPFARAPGPGRPGGASVEPTAGGTRETEPGRDGRPLVKPVADAGQGSASEQVGRVKHAAMVVEDTASPWQPDSNAPFGRDRGSGAQRTASAGSSGSDEEVAECSGEQRQEPPAVRQAVGTAGALAETAHQVPGMETLMVTTGLPTEEVPVTQQAMAELEKGLKEMMKAQGNTVATLRQEVSEHTATIAAQGARIKNSRYVLLSGCLFKWLASGLSNSLCGQ